MKMVVLAFVSIGVFFTGIIQAGEWTIDQVIEAKAMCFQASEEEFLESKSYRKTDVTRMFDLVSNKIEGEENYMSFADIFCSCKAKALSRLYSYEGYMLDTFLTEKKFFETDENKTCFIDSLSMAGALNQGGETHQPSVIQKWSIQIASYKQEKNAENLADKLVDAGYEASVVEANNIFRVMVGVFDSRREAELVRSKLKNQFRLSGFVIWQKD